MKTKFSGLLTLLLALVVQITFAQELQTVSGTVTDESGMPLPGVNVLIKGTTRGVQTDFDGNYAIEASNGEVLVFSYLGMKTTEFTFQDSPRIDVVMAADAAQLEEVVVTALGIKREEKSLPYASQTVNAEELNITEDTNIKTALAGKVAGVQINAQAGSKLGEAGKIRIRGGISLTSDADPLYVIDGIPTTDPNSIDMSNVATLNVLKGPNATALYGQRASNGVVQITTKRGADTDRIGIEITSSVTYDKVGNMMDYQNLYGQGYWTVRLNLELLISKQVHLVHFLIQTGCQFLTANVTSMETFMLMRAGDQNLMVKTMCHGMHTTKTAHTLDKLLLT